MLPLIVAWAEAPVPAWRRSWEVAALIVGQAVIVHRVAASLDGNAMTNAEAFDPVKPRLSRP